MGNIEIIQMKMCIFRTSDNLIIIFLMVIKYIIIMVKSGRGPENYLTKWCILMDPGENQQLFKNPMGGKCTRTDNGVEWFLTRVQCVPFGTIFCFR